MKRGLLLIVLFAFISMFISCSIDVAGGATSETTNGVVVSGIVLSQDGEPVSDAYVLIRPTDFLTDTSEIDSTHIPDAITDGSGYFSIDSLTPGTYYVVANDHGKMVTRDTIEITSVVTDSLNPITITLLPAAGFYGKIDRTDISDADNVYIQIYGMDRVTLADTSGEFLFSGLPAGSHIIRAISNNSTYGILEADTITIDPAENRDVGTFLLPFAFYRDTLAVRAILDSNGMADVSVVLVTNSKNGRIYELDLANKGITILPPVVTELRLKLLRLQDNNLDSIPNAIGTIPTLTYLSLLRNNLTSLPESVGNLNHLKHLNLGYNGLTELPSSITNLTKLGYLSVAHNRLHGVSSPVKIWLDTYSTESNWEELQDQ